MFEIDPFEKENTDILEIISNPLCDYEVNKERNTLTCEIPVEYKDLFLKFTEMMMR